MAPHPQRTRRPSTAEPPSTHFQRAPGRSQTAPVHTFPPLNRSYSSLNFVRPPSRTGTAASLERQTRLRAREEERVRRDTSAVEMRITHTHDVLLRALETMSKNARKESERIRCDLQRFIDMVESGATAITKDVPSLEAALRREETRVIRDFRVIRQIQDPKRRGSELDRLEAALEEGEKHIAYEFSRLQAARDAENQRLELGAATLVQARRNEEDRVTRDIQRFTDARSDARRRVDEELSSLARRGLTEIDLPSLHVQIQALRDRQKENQLRLDAAFASFNTQRSKATSEITLEARRITDTRHESKRASDDAMSRLSRLQHECKLRIDAEINRFMQSAERFSRASGPRAKSVPKVPPLTQSYVPPATRARKASYANPYAQTQPRTARGFTTERNRQQSQSQQARAAWESYEDRWTSLSNSNNLERLTFQNIPWPMFSQPGSVSQLNSRTIGAFILSSLHDGGGATRRDRIRNAMRIWHPDKWMSRYSAKVDPRHAQVVKEGVDAVTGALTELMAST